jgi:hypothetical protein
MRNPGKTLGSRQKVLEEKLPHLKQVGKHDSQIVSTEKEIKTYFSMVKPYIWSIYVLGMVILTIFNRFDLLLKIN